MDDRELHAWAEEQAQRIRDTCASGLNAQTKLIAITDSVIEIYKRGLKDGAGQSHKLKLRMTPLRTSK